jgi:hypothetical protein
LQISEEVKDAFLYLVNIRWLFIATWVDVVYYGSDICHSNPSDVRIPRNTWQAVLATDGTYSFAFFYYNKIMWTSGNVLSEDDPPVDICMGLGGHPARVGIYDGIKFYSTPGSCKTNILNITNLSNYESNKAPGKFAFKIDNAYSLD